MKEIKKGKEGQSLSGEGCGRGRSLRVRERRSDKWSRHGKGSEGSDGCREGPNGCGEGQTGPRV